MEFVKGFSLSANPAVNLNLRAFCAGGVNVRPYYGANGPVPVFISPNFMGSLRYSSAANFDLSQDDKTNVKGVTSNPGYQGLLQTQRMSVNYTAFVDMTSFAGLQCPARVIEVFFNAQLTSLAGLDGLSPSSTLERLVIRSNPLLKTAGPLRPLPASLAASGTGLLSQELP
jgi:hypothetical protein